MSSIKKSKSFNVTKLFESDEKLTFLVGAGASVEAPSQLPSTNDTMKALIKLSCANSEIETILKLQNLKFEVLVGIIHKSIEDDFRFLNFFTKSDKPNLEHFFLAEMIKKGHFVVTSNFDFLLEYALLQSDVPKKKIIPVITKKDYEKFSDPEKLYKNGKVPIYKIHGSHRNIITGEDTRTSFINTLKLIGRNQTESSIVQLEPYKAQFLVNISKERSLVVIGYSGKNDFDLLSTLKIMKNLNNLIWINHISDGGSKEDLYEFDAQKSSDLKNIDKLDQFLLEIKQLNGSVNVFRLNVNTSKFLEKFFKDKEKLSKDKFSIDLMEWFKTNIDEPNELTKLFISYKIYSETKNYTDGLRCLERIFRISEDSGNAQWKAIALMEMGIINYVQLNYSEALEWLRKSLQIQLKIKVFPQRTSIFKYIALIHQAKKNYSEALQNFEFALKEKYWY